MGAGGEECAFDTQPHPRAAQDQLPNVPIRFETLQQCPGIQIHRAIDTGCLALLRDARKALIIKGYEAADDYPVKGSFKGKFRKSRARAAHKAADGSEKEQPEIHEKSGRINPSPK